MKKVLLYCFLLASFQLNAAIISLVPSTDNADVGDLITLDIIISQLAPGGAPSLSGFDLNVNFASSVLSLDTTDADGDGVFDSIILDPDSQLDVFDLGFNFFGSAMLSAGLVNLFELSLDLPQDLDLFQANTFTLAQIQFSAIGEGVSGLIAEVNALSDGLGDALSVTSNNSELTVRGTGVKPVPEPGMMWVFLIAAGGGLLQRYRQKRLI